MKALVTGGGGFLGTEIVKQLLERGYSVRSFSRSHHPILKSLSVEEIRGDLANADDVSKAVSGCDIVFHAGAKAGYWGPYMDYYNSNVKGTKNVIDACLTHNISRLIYTSSPSVVFNGKDLENADESVPYPEHYEASYPKTKAIAEKMVLEANCAKLATVALRPHLIFGPGDNHLVPGIIAKAKSKNLRLVGNGKNKVDVIYIYNAALAHLLAAEKLGPGNNISGKVYFISNSNPKSMSFLFNEIIDIYNLPPLKMRIPFALAYLGGWLFEKIYSFFNIQKEPLVTRFIAREVSSSHWFNNSQAKEDFGYEPVISVEDGFNKLREFVQK